MEFSCTFSMNKQEDSKLFDELSKAFRAEKIDTATSPPYQKNTVQYFANQVLHQVRIKNSKGVLMGELMAKLNKVNPQIHGNDDNDND